MGRLTKEERTARAEKAAIAAKEALEAERKEREEEYPTLFLETFKALLLTNHQLVKITEDNQFVLEGLDIRNNYQKVSIPYYFNDRNWEIDFIRTQALRQLETIHAERAKRQAKEDLINRLTKEERELLGL